MRWRSSWLRSEERDVPPRGGRDPRSGPRPPVRPLPSRDRPEPEPPEGRGLRLRGPCEPRDPCLRLSGPPALDDDTRSLSSAHRRMAHRWSQMKKGRKAIDSDRPSALLTFMSGSDLLSQAVASQVPSALAGFTSVFGKGTGGSPPLSPPDKSSIRWLTVFTVTSLPKPERPRALHSEHVIQDSLIQALGQLVPVR